MTDSYSNEKEKMQKTVDVLLHEFDSIRAGRANAAVLDRLHIEYYGAQSPIDQVASISIPEPRVLVIQPWDSSILKEIEKAIMTSDIGINPQNDGKVIRLLFPQLTEERRHELVRQIHKYSEESKVAIRNIRRDALDHYKKQQKKSEITEDDLKDIEKDIQDLTEQYCDKIDALNSRKEKELLEV